MKHSELYLEIIELDRHFKKILSIQDQSNEFGTFQVSIEAKQFIDKIENLSEVIFDWIEPVNFNVKDEGRKKYLNSSKRIKSNVLPSLNSEEIKKYKSELNQKLKAFHVFRNIYKKCISKASPDTFKFKEIFSKELANDLKNRNSSGENIKLLSELPMKLGEYLLLNSEFNYLLNQEKPRSNADIKDLKEILANPEDFIKLKNLLDDNKFIRDNNNQLYWIGQTNTDLASTTLLCAFGFVLTQKKYVRLPIHNTTITRALLKTFPNEHFVDKYYGDIKKRLSNKPLKGKDYDYFHAFDFIPSK